MEATQSKTCRCCGVEKPLERFYAHPQARDGHINQCKPCVKARVAEYRIRKTDQCRAYDRARARLPHRIAARQGYMKTEAGKRAATRANRVYRRMVSLGLTEFT